MIVSILLYGCTTCTEKRLDGNCTRILSAILKESWKQHPTKHELYGHLPPITKTIQIRRKRYAGPCWRSKNELISDVLQWTTSYGHASVGRPTKTYLQQLCTDTGCSLEDLPEAMDDIDERRERESQGYLCLPRDMLLLLLLMMMMMMISGGGWYIYIYIVCECN